MEIVVSRASVEPERHLDVYEGKFKHTQEMRTW